MEILNMTILKQSPHQSFQITQLCESVAICEAVGGDRYGWDNGTDISPAFLVYVGCTRSEVKGYVQTFNTFYRCNWCEVRKPRHLKDFEAEIKIRGMQRSSDSQALGLDYLLESEEAKHLGCDLDEYAYYTVGYLPRW
jgi:hypothetical protein